MGELWQAEHVVDEATAGALVRAQFPELAARSVELVSAGWDYTIHRVDGQWAFRFPRRSVVLEPMQLELRVLPLLAPRLPVAVPAPVHVGVPGEGYPWAFYGSHWLDGAEATGTARGDALAADLGRFLRALHDIELDDLPVDVNGRADMTKRVAITRQALADAADLWTAPTAVEELLETAEALPPGERVVCHGDLHFRQLLVADGRLAGVVDWVDVCRSDPGIDLMVVYAFLPPELRPAFFAEYGPAAGASLVRARVLALNMSAILARYGRAQANRPVEAEAIASLDRAVAGI